jgi:caa(3)-type oxidase subunit IV
VSDVRDTVFEADHAHTVPATAAHLTTFAVLVVLAVVALGVGFSDLGGIKVVVSLAIAAVQTVIMGYFFMDLKQADKLTWLCVGAAGFWLVILFVFLLTDYVTRHYAVI